MIYTDSHAFSDHKYPTPPHPKLIQGPVPSYITRHFSLLGSSLADDFYKEEMIVKPRNVVNGKPWLYLVVVDGYFFWVTANTSIKGLASLCFFFSHLVVKCGLLTRSNDTIAWDCVGMFLSRCAYQNLCLVLSCSMENRLISPLAELCCVLSLLCLSRLWDSLCGVCQNYGIVSAVSVRAMGLFVLCLSELWNCLGCLWQLYKCVVSGRAI